MRSTRTLTVVVGAIVLFVCSACLLWQDLPGSAQGSIVNQGVKAIGADAWHVAGYDGTGVKVAVWDFSFYGYGELVGTELPPTDRLITRGFGVPIVGWPDEDPEDAAHGTAVAEVVYDIAPGATFYLIATDEDTDAHEALEWMIEEKIDVVVASISVEGWCLDEGTSPFEPVFRRLREARVLLIAASGNDGLSHWQGPFTDADGDDLHEFHTGEEELYVELYRDEVIDTYLQWGDPCRPSSTDLVFRIVDDLGNVIAESDYDSALDGPFEDLYAEVPYDGLYRFEIERFSGPKDVFLDLIWPNGPPFEDPIEAGSISYYEPAVSQHVLTVGSINWNTFELESTSSRGPTKDGRIKPDLVAPTCLITASYGGIRTEYREEDCAFGGTSAAAPVVAGAAALVKQAFPAFTADQVQAYLEEHAIDMGAPGKDNVYGAGRLLLPTPPSSS